MRQLADYAYICSGFSIMTSSMDYRLYLITLSSLTLATQVRAQDIERKKQIVTDEKPATDMKQLQKADSLKRDFEEWLRNEPLQPEHNDSITIHPQMPSSLIENPLKPMPSQQKVSIPIITPALLTDMRLAYNSHWLEEQRKAQQGGAMTIGVTINPLTIVSYVLHKILPHRKTRKQRERERLKQILDNY